MKTAERVSQVDASDNYVFQRSLLAYVHAAGMVGGTVLEIGTGSGYGIEHIAPNANRFITIDKHRPAEELLAAHSNVEFVQQNVPPLKGIASESVDWVISFQVIEHIKRDSELVAEVHRVLKKGGKFICSTPNAPMSLTRNPWHVREYSAEEFFALMNSHFGNIEQLGVEGNEQVWQYYEQNRLSVERIARLDILDLQHRLPRQILQLPYDILNRLNRRKLLKQNTSLTASIRMEDYAIVPVHERCFDLYFVATK